MKWKRNALEAEAVLRDVETMIDRLIADPRPEVQWAGFKMHDATLGNMRGKSGWGSVRKAIPFTPEGQHSE